MGYRSQVCIGLTDNAARLLMTMVDHLPEHHEARHLLKASTGYGPSHARGERLKHRCPDSDCETKFYWDNVKWYEGYEDVGFIEEFVSEAIEPEDYRFVRVGEETDDLEERGEYYDAEIWVTRSISW